MFNLLLGVILRIVRTEPWQRNIVHDACIKIWTRAASFQPGLGFRPRLDLQRIAASPSTRSVIPPAAGHGGRAETAAAWMP